MSVDVTDWHEKFLPADEVLGRMSDDVLGGWKRVPPREGRSASTSESREGWLGVGARYVGDDDDFDGWDCELYSDAPYLGSWQSVPAWLDGFDRQRVRITVELLETPP